MSAAQIFRQCTASLSARSLARPATHASRRAALGARWYSEAAAEPAKDPAPDTNVEGTPAPDAECQAKLKAKEAELTDMKGRLQYLQADFLNLQRNAAREKEQTRDFAITKFATDLVDTVDILGLALKSVPQSVLAPTLDSSHPASSASPAEPSSPSDKPAQAYLNELYTGVEATQRLLLSTLFKYQIKPFDPTGDKFDPNKHEALYQAPIPGKEAGTVIDCQKPGYMIKDRVLRAAQVGVAAETS